jgi:hypothetical protein
MQGEEMTALEVLVTIVAWWVTLAGWVFMFYGALVAACFSTVLLVIVISAWKEKK